MAENINLLLKSKEQIDMIAKAVKDRQASIRLQIGDLHKELDSLTALMSQIYPTQTAIADLKRTTSMNGYNMDWSISKKAEYVIGKNNKPMTTAEIANAIVNEYETNADRKYIVRNLSVVFATQKNRFKKSQNEKGENIYMV